MRQKRNSSKTIHYFLLLLAFMFCICMSAIADDQRFDLRGPTIFLSVARNGVTLPIAEVPNLLPNDHLKVRADLPATQSNRLLLVVAFLRSTTNEPPDEWFTRIETWTPQGQRTKDITVPVGAQRAVIFLAPAHSGDFDTLRSVVKKNPGVFSHAADSLFKVSLQQQRIERYLAGMQAVAQEEDKVIAARSAKLASALVLKPDADCFKQPVDDQVDCLTQTSAPMLLDTGNEQTISAAISTGASSDFINEASQNDGGVYSAYVGTVIDLVHLLGLLHTAQYRYIPAITLPQGTSLNTRLNTAPSFGNPMSVIVVALPPIQASRLPDLHLATPRQAFCLRDPEMVLPLRGSTSFYSTEFAHDLYLDFGSKMLPITPDVLAGGLIRDPSRQVGGVSPVTDSADEPFLRARLRGRWGFDEFDGPELLFQRSEGIGWKIMNGPFLAGQTSPQQLRANATACLHNVFLHQPDGTASEIPFTMTDDGSINLSMSTHDRDAGKYVLQLSQYGSVAPIALPFTERANEGGDVELASLSPDGKNVLMTGKKLDQIAVISTAGGRLTAASPATQSDAIFTLPLKRKVSVGDDLLVTYLDGRSQNIALVAEDATTTLHVLALQPSVENPPTELAIELLTAGAIPLHSTLHFMVGSDGVIAPTDRIEIATVNGEADAVLSFLPPDASLVLEDAHTIVGSIDLDRKLGESAFGALHIRMVRANGEKGAWVEFGTLVRRPHLSSVHCDAKNCVLHGREIFLMQEISTTQDLQGAVQIPRTAVTDDFSFTVEKARAKTLYCSLRDNPSIKAAIPITAAVTVKP
ncbi:hypothetical protein [Terriglobus roseus]|uniref:Uncharacterized protein n=1 Tax=Terriglobus roseus TaxID=392734 RepID=A0A1G7JAX0_9BACT|nr:hypothetical protein [Terriglobus roseus]SDF22102.1 hypothetical protein SAMN05444167_1753 [Terriglobus roseus]